MVYDGEDGESVTNARIVRSEHFPDNFYVVIDREGFKPPCRTEFFELHDGSKLALDYCQETGQVVAVEYIGCLRNDKQQQS